MTECTAQTDLFSIGRRAVTAVFDGLHITSNGGAVLLKKIDERVGLTESLSALIRDERDAARVEHTILDLIRQRIYQICCGHPDCNDAERLRHDPALQLALGRVPDAANVLASQPTLSRLEAQVGPRELLRISEVFVAQFVRRLRTRGRKNPRIVLDFDATDDPTHGQQELSFFRGHYDQHMYYPLLVFADDGFPLAAVLRPGSASAHEGTIAILARVIGVIRRRFPRARFLFRADGGFALPEIYEFCERERIDYVIGQTTHAAWKAKAADLLAQARALPADAPQRCYGEFTHRAASWTRPRRILVKAEVTNGEDNPRFVVTNLTTHSELAYTLYTARGQSENYIKDLKNAMLADRLSCHRFWANQFRLLLHVAAYLLMFLLREAHARMHERAMQLDTLRLLLIKVGAKIRVSARRVWVHLSSSQPDQQAWLATASCLATGPPA